MNHGQVVDHQIISDMILEHKRDEEEKLDLDADLYTVGTKQ
jgi:hypothetical protein